MLINIDSIDRDSGSNNEFTVDLSYFSHHHAKNGGWVAVKSAKLPYTFYNVNQNNGSFVVTYQSGQQKTIYMGNNATFKYGSPSASTALAFIKAQLDVNTEASVWTLSIDASRGTLSIYATGLNVDGNTWSIVPQNVEAARILGLEGLASFTGVYNNNSSSTPPSTPAIPSYSPNAVNFSPIRNLFIRSNIQVKSDHVYNAKDKKGSDIIAIIPLTGNFGSNVFFTPSELAWMEVSTFSSQSFRVTDDLNRTIDFNGVPWSLQLEFSHVKK